MENLEVGNWFLGLGQCHLRSIGTYMLRLVLGTPIEEWKW